ncbi:hypothetical protein FPV67DRAFT_116551 [Lyophyllum atratum]|nr:hypothetical protein FPV67DRAFT_116551 [Lyophyllum atratum]
MIAIRALEMDPSLLCVVCFVVVFDVLRSSFCTCFVGSLHLCWDSDVSVMGMPGRSNFALGWAFGPCLEEGCSDKITANKIGLKIGPLASRFQHRAADVIPDVSWLSRFMTTLRTRAI